MKTFDCLTVNAAPARAMHPSTDSGSVRVAVQKCHSTTKSNLRLRLLTPLLALALAGCGSTPLSPNSSASHPANAQAAQSPVPPLQPGLLTITNMATATPTNTLAQCTPK